MLLASRLALPISSESWNSLVMIGASSKAKSCRNLVGTASGRAALYTFRPVSSLYNMYKPLLLTWMFFKFWCGLSLLDGLSNRIFVV